MTSLLRIRRAGMGAPFLVVLSVMVILSLYAISMSVRSQGVSQATRKALYLETCEELGRFAIDEAIYRTRAASNDPDHPLHEFLRSVEPGRTAELPLAELEVTQRELDRHSAYSVSTVRLSVTRQAAAARNPEEVVNYEAVGILAFAVDVTGPESSEITQVAEIDYHTVLTTVPRPFDAFTVFLGNADLLLRAGSRGGDPNATMQWAVDAMAEIRRKIETSLAGIPPLLAELRQKLSDAESSAFVDGDIVDKLKDAIQATETMQRDLRQALEAPRWPADPMWTLEDVGEETTGERNTLHRFEMPLTVYSLAPGVSLEKIHLPSQVMPRIQAILDREVERQDAAAAGEAAEAQMATDPLAMVPALKRTLQVAEQDLADFHNMLLAYKEFQDLLIEVTGEFQGELLERSRRLFEVEMRRRATFVFEGPGKAAKAAEFLAQRPPPVGMVFVKDPDEPLVVDVQGLVGRLVVYTPGDMVVEGATGDPAQPNTHALVLICAKEMRVLTDDVQAALVSPTGDFQGPGTSFSGALILAGFRDLAAADLNLKGAVTHIPVLRSSEATEPRPPPEPYAITAVLGPAPLFRRAER